MEIDSSLRLHEVGLVPQIQSTALQDKAQVEPQNHDMTYGEIFMTNDIMVIEQKISKLEVRYKQRGQKLEQQKSILITKDMLHMCSTMTNNVVKNFLCLMTYDLMIRPMVKYS